MDIYTIFTIAVCLIIEYFFPRKNQNFFSNSKLKDLFWFIINEILFNLILAYSMVRFTVDATPKLNFLNISSLNLISQFFIFYLIIDFINYWAHRMLHTFKPLKYIHKIHHSATELSPLTTFRHPLLEHLYFYFILGMIASCFEMDNQVKALAIGISISIDIIQHSNFDIRAPYFLNYVFILPKNHYYHHAKEHFLKGGQNFGLTFSFWDIMFKSFYLPREGQNIEIGLRNDKLAKNPFSLIMFPFFTNKESRSKPIL